MTLLLSLTFVGCTKPIDKLTITTKPVAEITINSAKSGGNISATGNIKVQVCGICWSESPSPTTNDFFTTDSQGNGEYISSMRNLKAGTKYYVRAYATTNSGVMYGEEKDFTTLPEGGGDNGGGGNGGGNGGDNTSFSVSTHDVTGITASTAQCGGVVTCNGNVPISARGVCWSTSPNPTIAQPHTTDGQGAGSFTSTLTGLSANTSYYVKTYAQSGSDIVYGEEKTFTTLADGGGGNGGGTNTFSVSTHGVTEITATTAQCGGVVTCNGNVTISARGVCWSTLPNPTIAQPHTIDGQGTGSFTSTLTGLSANTTYYVKAYAQSGSDIVYGAEMNFTTTEPPQQPTVTVTLVNVTPTSLELKFEPSINTSYYCCSVGSTLSSTTHYTGFITKTFEQSQNIYFQPDTEYEFTVVAYGMDGTAGEMIHPKFTTSPAPYANYLRVYNNFYPLNTATIRHGVWSGNTNLGYKEIIINGNSGYWVLLQYNCYYYEIDNVWYSGIYTMNGGDIHQYNCRYAKNGSIDGVDGGSTFTITKSGNMTTYDLYGNQGAGKGCITAHFTGVPTY